MLKKYLMIPGPTPIPEEVKQAMIKDMVGHRSSDFKGVFTYVMATLKEIFQTKNDVFVLGSSGTGAMEAALVNVISPGDKVLVVEIGNFGDRFASMATALGANVEKLSFPWGTAADPKVLKERLDKDKNKEIKVVTLQQNETSTAVLNDVQALAKVISEHGALSVVDAVSGMAVADLRTDEWGLDLVAAGSQKAFMIPPGLAFISVSPKAWAAIEKAKAPKFYFDLRKAKDFGDKGETPWTPAISLYTALDASLKMMKQEGLANLYAYYDTLKVATRAAIRAMGLELFVPDDKIASPAVTAIKGPEGLDVEELRKKVRSGYGVGLAGGQKHLKGKIFRIGHLGYIGPFDIITSLAALEMTLNKMGKPVKLGTGVAAAQEVFLKNLK